jgi:catechol 2,3-dioxygenase-like lactoylglutathione lyase family enzyme
VYKRIDYVALQVADLARSVAFYVRHFGFKNYAQQTGTGGPRIAHLKLGAAVC